MRRTRTAGAKNFDASNEEASTKVSRAVRALQDKLPLSRVIYASATGVSEIKNMACAERRGLWGACAATPGFASGYWFPIVQSMPFDTIICSAFAPGA